MRRAALTLLVAVCLVAPAACSKSSGSKEKFCAALPGTGDVMSILSDFGTADSATLEKRFDDEKASPEDVQDVLTRAARLDAMMGRARDIILEADGRVRFSAHLYNDGEDVERALEATRHAVSVLGG